MAWFSFRKRSRTVVVIDIGSGSVGGAYAHYIEGETPILYYTVRIPVEPRGGEGIEAATRSALKHVERRLVEEGAPTLRRETGTGSADTVLAAIAAPWQEFQVVSRSIARPNPFIFTKHTLDELLREIPDPESGRVLAGTDVLATILNGYETANPIGRRTRKADVVMLASTLDMRIADAVRTSLQTAFHTHGLHIGAFLPAAYAVFKDLYPLQREFLMLDVSGAATDVALVRQGLFAGSETFYEGTLSLGSGAGAWQAGLTKALGALKETQPLPRTLFLFSDDEHRERLKQLLEETSLQSLWLPGEGVSVVPVLPGQLAAHVKTRGLAEADVFLATLALYAPKVL